MASDPLPRSVDLFGPNSSFSEAARLRSEQEKKPAPGVLSAPPKKFDAVTREEAPPEIKSPFTLFEPSTLQGQEGEDFNEEVLNKLVAASTQSEKDREFLRQQKYFLSVQTGLGDANKHVEFEGSRGALAVAKMKDFEANDPMNAFRDPDPEVATGEKDSFDPAKTIKSTVNFLFSDEMGVLGYKWDNKGFNWSKENFINQITEHPYSTAFTLASYIVPVGLAWSKGARVAERAAKLSGIAGNAGAASGKGLLGTSLGFKFDDHAQLVQQLAHTSVNDGRQLFSKSVLDKLALATTPEEIRKIVSPSDLKKILIGDYHQEKYFDLRNKAKRGTLTTKERASYAMWKTFGNTYFSNLQDMNKAQIEGMDDFFKKMQFGRLLAQAPNRLGADGEKAIYKYWADKTTRNYSDLQKAVGDINALWADDMLDRGKKLFQSQYDEGFIDEDTFKLFNEAIGSEHHLPAIKKGTAGFEDIGGTILTPQTGRYGELTLAKKLDPAKALTGPTTKHRAQLDTRQKVLDALDAGTIETDPAKLTVGGHIKDQILFQAHKNFRDIIVDGTEDTTGKWAQWLTSKAAYDLMRPYAKKNWVHFEDLDSVVPGLYDRMRRMVDARVVKDGLNPAKYADLPAIDKDVLKQFFGGDGSQAKVGGTFAKFWEIMTAVHKTSRTALNFPTHMSNITGNLMFLAMAGMNPFSPQALNDGKIMTSVFRKITSELKSGNKSIDELMDHGNLTRFLGKDRFIVDDFGEQVDLAEMFSDSIMKDLIEHQSFEEVEGLVHVHRQLTALEKLEGSGWGDAALKTVARAIAGVGDTPGIKQTLHAASSAYLAEDMIPKMMYSMNLARKGFGRDAIIREVGRRLPQYRTVGGLARDTRRVLLPWITFPTEAARIMKNNMMDHPIAMTAWLQAPQIAQSAVSALGLGPDFSEMEGMIDAAPPWAVRYQTAYLKENTAAATLGTIGGAAVGGVAGAALGGAKGAAVGLAAGAVGMGAVGAKFGSKSTDDLAEFNRAWTLDFLPQSAVFPSSMSPGQWAKVNPFDTNNPTTGKEAFATAKDLSPVEPFAVFMPILELWSGRGSFGRELEAKSGIEMANKMALGLLGHLTPPIMQKYGMGLAGPGGAIIPMAKIHEDNGGQMTLPKAATATFGGLALGGLTFIGGKTGLGLKGAGLAASTALSATVGGMAGAEINTTRFMEDLGIKKNTRTHDTADWTLDFLANSFFGVNKSWKVSPGQLMYNKHIRNNTFTELRSISVKQLGDSIISGSNTNARLAISEIKDLYIKQFGNTEVADREFIDWAERFTDTVTKLPISKGLSKEQLNIMVASLKASNAEKTKIQRQYLSELETELEMRKMRKASGLKINVNE